MSSVHNQKPLPALPPGFTNALASGARRHRADLIRSFLLECGDSGILAQVDVWLQEVESALDSLNYCLKSSGGLSALKRSRERGKVPSQKIGRNASEKTVGSQDTIKQRKASPSQEGVHESLEHGTTDGIDNSIPLPQILERIKSLTFEASLLTPSTQPAWLILCLAPFGPPTFERPTYVPEGIGCSFTPDAFQFPEPGSGQLLEDSVLFNLREWQTIARCPANSIHLRPIGGTFTLTGVNAPQHRILSTVLRLSIFLHLSLLLEQDFLTNSRVVLDFSQTRSPFSSPLVDLPPTTNFTNSDANTRSKNRNSFLPNGLFNFFTRKTPGSRASSSNGEVSRSAMTAPGYDIVPKENSERRSSEDRSLNILQPLSSFISENRPSFLRSSEHPKDFSDLLLVGKLKTVEEGKHLLSTSPGIIIPPPSLLVDLAEKERQKPTRHLKGDERTGLSSLLGWEGTDTRGKGMVGVSGFVRQQEFSVLFSQYVPNGNQGTSSSESSSTASASSNQSQTSSSSLSSITSVGPTLFSPCDRPQLVTYRFYSHDPLEDMRLGDFIQNRVVKASTTCDIKGCRYLRGEHQWRLIHGGMRIDVNVGEDTVEDEVSLAEDEMEIQMWESCKVCGSKSERRSMSDGTYLLSYGKFLELLVYSPAVCTLTPALCEHTTPPSQPWKELPTSRLHIVRKFSHKAQVVSFSLALVDDIFELRVPRLQILRHSADKIVRNPETSEDRDEAKSGLDDDKKILRREIKRWWESVADHMDKLGTLLEDADARTVHKALPRLPSTDDAFDEVEDLNFQHAATHPNRPLTLHAPNPSISSVLTASTATPANVDSASGQPLEPARLLASLRHTFHRTEQSLHSQLSKTPATSLNDVRRVFLSAAMGADKRLYAWQEKHLPSISGTHLIDHVVAEQPTWWGKGHHVPPSGNVIIREDDWGSIIAFTLSSADYQDEIDNMSTARTSSTSSTSSNPPSPPPTSQTTSFFSAAAGYRLFTSSVQSQPDPDKDDVTWDEPEAFSAVISRKEHPRDPTSLLSFREVLRHRQPLEGIPLGRIGSAGSSTTRLAGAPPLAWAKPEVQLNTDEADGEVTGLPDLAVVEKKLHQVEAAASASRGNITKSELPSTVTMTDVITDTVSSLLEPEDTPGEVKRVETSEGSSESGLTIGKDGEPTVQLLPPPLPPKDRRSPKRVETFNTQTSSITTSGTAQTTSTITNTITSSLGLAMRYMLKQEEQPTTEGQPAVHHGLLSTDGHSPAGERPHIKYDWTIGKRLKFSCTVYYARQFDVLRRRCGIEDVFLRSMSQSCNWAADGGKSKANFWKTTDERFVIKTLVNAWNVADLHVLLDLGPSYFRYMDSTASKPTALAKLLGFYTIEIRNLETGAVQAKADLLVMENLFYRQKVVKTFDLKGIQGRKVKAATGAGKDAKLGKTLFDGEWIEGQQKSLLLVRPYSKSVLHEAIASDADFLARSNIMDYSLLVGIDEENKQIDCGLVDTIGSYTFAKTLEYKAKHGLKTGGKEVTVVPPLEYQERFVSALEGYFVPCPDKWTKPADSSRVVSDPHLLPSVL